MKDTKSFFKLGIIYTIGQVLSKIISFIFVPLYTRELGKIGYGKLALADTVMEVLSSFLILCVYTGYIRFYRECCPNERNRLRNTAINFSIFMAILDIVIVGIFGRYIANIFLNFDSGYIILVLIVIRSLITQFITLFMSDYNLNYEARVTVTTNTIMMLINVCLTIVFVVIKKQGIIGIYNGYICSSLMIFMYLLIKNRKRYKLEIDKKMLKDMLKFSLGLIPGNLSGAILTLSDRYFLVGYRDFGEAGIYSIGYKFGMLVQPLFIEPFKSIFTPYKFEIWKDKNSDVKFNDMFRKYHFFGGFIILLISCYSKFIINIFTTKEYIEAYKLIPLVLFSYFLYGKACFYNLGIHLRNKTYLDSIIMLAGGVINIFLNILFIPKWGMYGAAWATMVSYLIMNIIYIKFAMPMYHIRYKFKMVFCSYSIIMGIYLIYYIISVTNISLLLDIPLGVVLLLIYMFLCIKLDIVKRSEIYTIFQRINKKKVFLQRFQNKRKKA